MNNKKKKWENPQWISLDNASTASGSGSGMATEGMHTPLSMGVLGS